jgi:hypothetical protein
MAEDLSDDPKAGALAGAALDRQVRWLASVPRFVRTRSRAKTWPLGGLRASVARVGNSKVLLRCATWRVW